MTTRRIVGAGAALALILAAAPARAEARLEASVPQANSTIPAPANLFEVRFNEPVNHYQSRLDILRDGQVLETLEPRLRTEPMIIAAMSRPLAAGRYELRWQVMSAFDGRVTQGTIPFTVQ